MVKSPILWKARTFFSRHLMWFAVALLLSTGAFAVAQADEIKGYLPAGVTVADFPAAPVTGSDQDQKDRAAALDLQAKRTPERVALAQADQKLDVYAAFGSVLGPDITEATTPKLAQLMRRASRDVGATVYPIKETYKRPRPPLADPAVTPCVRLPENGLNSYPSGHAMWGTTIGAILADLIPAKAEALQARARDFGASRAVCGVHYPSDVAAGQALAVPLLARLRTDPAFQADFDAARAELRLLKQTP